MKAIVLGATGAVGKDLTAMLLEDESFEQVAHAMIEIAKEGKTGIFEAKDIWALEK